MTARFLLSLALSCFLAQYAISNERDDVNINNKISPQHIVLLAQQPPEGEKAPPAEPLQGPPMQAPEKQAPQGKEASPDYGAQEALPFTRLYHTRCGWFRVYYYYGYQGTAVYRMHCYCYCGRLYYSYFDGVYDHFYEVGGSPCVTHWAFARYSQTPWGHRSVWYRDQWGRWCFYDWAHIH